MKSRLSRGGNASLLRGSFFVGRVCSLEKVCGDSCCVTATTMHNGQGRYRRKSWEEALMNRECNQSKN